MTRKSGATQTDGAAGVYAALATPRRRDSVEADTAAYLEYLDQVTRAGVAGLVFFGSTGEFIHFDIGERMRVVSLAAKRSRAPVLVNVSHSTLAGAREMGEHAVDAGASGLLLMPPYFYRYTGAEIVSFYEAFAASFRDRIPIYLYNLPQFTTPMTADVLNGLLQSGVFAGIKDSSGDWDIFTSLKELRGRLPFQLLVGHERVYVRALQEGASGIVSGVAAAVPELVVAIEKSGGTQPDLTARLDEFLGWIEQFPATVVIKEAAEARRWLQSTVALPLSPQTEQHLAQFRTWFSRWLPETLEACAVRT